MTTVNTRDEGGELDQQMSFIAAKWLRILYVEVVRYPKSEELTAENRA
ncbi:hypothetical protein ACFQVD_00145 [Streptosporangium amethystogenes subsp. fukuiense]|uniref:Uncharacterized protein n=1 Tax=Streptosporangium amethystogenes subsp. fukuiense TaxID=698418 RepID=A0ABW2SR70_9ACTN